MARPAVAARKCLALALSLALLAPRAAAQEAPPPEPGAAILEDPLTGPGAVRAADCPTGRNSRAFVPEGYLLRVTGRCTEASTTASVARLIEGLSIPDGEIRIELRAVSGAERARFRLSIRSDLDGNERYFVALEPARGLLQLVKGGREGDMVLGTRTDLAGLLSPDGWNSLAVRAQGPHLWLLVNDQLVLSAVDSAYDSGTVILALARLGSVDDDQETSVVVRNLRVSGLVGGDQARLPTYGGLRPLGVARPEASPFGPPWIGDLAFGYDPSGAGAVAAGGRLPLAEGSSLYCFFSWLDLPPRARIGIELRWGDELRASYSFTPPFPLGRTRVPVTTFTAASGGAHYAVDYFTVIFRLDGRELARGSIQLT